MRKLLLILMLSPCLSVGQVSVTRAPISCCFTGGIANFSGLTFNAGALYIMFVGVSNTSGGAAAATVSLSGTGQTWDEITSAGGVANGGNFKRIQAFRFAPTSNNSNTVTFTLGGTGAQDGMWMEIAVITGVDVTGTNGSNAIVQNIVGSANSANPTLTLTNPILNRGAVLFALINGTNPFGGTPESGWTTASNNGFATPDTGDYWMYRTNTIDNTPTVTASSDNWAGIAIELKASGRRIFNTH